MNVTVIGLGYVGLVTAACLADWGNVVVGSDRNRQRLDVLRRGEIPFHEPGLDALVTRNAAIGRMRFTSDAAVAGADAVVVAVGTHDGNGGWQTISMQSCLEEIVPRISTGTPLIIRSTLPPEYIAHLGENVEAIRTQAGRSPIPVLLNPEFTREGSAIHDFVEPERIVIGTVHDPDERGAARLKELYAPVTAPMLNMSAMDAAFAKLGANLFLATKISFANELAALCDAYGARVDTVVQAMGYDSRIGAAFLHAGVGFGGSCLPNQVAMTVEGGRRDGVHTPLLEAVEHINHRQRAHVVTQIQQMVGSLAGHRIALLGLTFKPNTDDLRDAPSLTVASELLRAGAEVVSYDPMRSARDQASRLVRGLRVVDDPYAAMAGSSAVALITDWPELLAIDWRRAAAEMDRPILFDGRNALDPDELMDAGFVYAAFGRMASWRHAGDRIYAFPIAASVRRRVAEVLDELPVLPQHRLTTIDSA